jgi:Selenoprotein, putative
MRAMMLWVRVMWQGLRDWCGDSAYETYAACAAKKSVVPELSREEFYLAQMERKYSRVNRCC